MSYLNSITLVGFVGSDPEQRQAKGNGSKFTVLSVATQRSWKNADDEWSSKIEWHRVVVFRPLLAERVATTIKKGAHVLVEGSLVSSTYEQPNGKGKKSKGFVHTELHEVKQVAGERTNSRSDKGSVADEYERKQRDQIIRALTACKGRVGGADGAAARLGMNRTTLLSRMKKFGIYPKQYA